MTERLYYHDSFLHEFDGEVVEVIPASASESRPGVVLDRTAFYPTSGGQVHDAGILTAEEDARLRVSGVADMEDGRVVHYIEAEKAPQKGSRVHGVIDAGRRRDHMQQHSGQHVLSAAFVRLFNMHTVSFHMGEDYCSIDLDTPALTQEQVVAAEKLANQVIMENRPVHIRFVTQEEAAGLGLRKVPPVERDKLRLIDIQDFDLTACGGTHVEGTGQIGSILLRKTEKVRQGWRVEFVCGDRAIKTARRDYSVLTETAGLFSAGLWEIPAHARKLLEDARAARRQQERLLEESAEFHARELLAGSEEKNGRKLVIRVFSDRDLPFIKLLGQKVIRLDSHVVALLATTSGQRSLIFAQSAGQPFDMGALMKQVMAQVGGRGGGSKDMAQGGVPETADVEAVLRGVQEKLLSGSPVALK
jgi:alanyl-tRNA synthetase